MDSEWREEEAHGTMCGSAAVLLRPPKYGWSVHTMPSMEERARKKHDRACNPMSWSPRPVGHNTFVHPIARSA